MNEPRARPRTCINIKNALPQDRMGTSFGDFPQRSRLTDHMSRALLGVALPLTTSWLGTRKAAPARYGSSSIQGRRPNQEDRCALAMQPVQPAGRQRQHGKSARWTTLPELTRRASRRIRSLHACDRLPGHPDCALYAVYDGHGGAVSSSPTRRDLLLILARRLPTRPKRASGLLGDLWLTHAAAAQQL